MAYNEHIYIQQMDYTADNGSVVQPECIDLEARFGFVGKAIPFQVGGEAKEIFSQEWLDEDGDDEYVPEIVKMKGYEMEVELAYKGSNGSANQKIQALRSYLTGRTGGGAARFKMYSTYTGIGRQDIRFVKIADDAELVRKPWGDILIIKVTFKVNDPTHDVIYSGGRLI